MQKSSLGARQVSNFENMRNLPLDVNGALSIATFILMVQIISQAKLISRPIKADS